MRWLMGLICRRRGHKGFHPHDFPFKWCLRCGLTSTRKLSDPRWD